MRGKAGGWALSILAVVLAGYLGLCGYLFTQQRRLIFQPTGVALDGPPAGSGLQLLEVDVPGLGVLKHWWSPPAPGAPTIAFFHGNAADRASLRAQGDFFRKRGWGVLLASYRGYSGNPGKPSEAGFMADARATLEAVAPRAGPVILWGHSLGSGVAARMAAEGRGAGLVLEAPFTSVADVAAPRYPYVPVRLLLLDRFDTRGALADIKAPVLIIHGADDPQIPISMGKALADQLGSRGTFVTMDGVGHYPHSRDLSDRVVRWAHETGVTG